MTQSGSEWHCRSLLRTDLAPAAEADFVAYENEMAAKASAAKDAANEKQFKVDDAARQAKEGAAEARLKQQEAQAAATQAQ